ncbi:MAG: tRNA preQ1(34) S-adenosylmethionine ribosyltransferase-isomerase QueA [Acetobacterales bacterium]
MRTDDFDFDLPRDLIAQAPALPRDSARLLSVGPGLDDRRVGDLPALLRPGDLLVVNDTRVIPARLTGLRGEAHVEVTLAEDLGNGCWRAFARPGRRLRPGDTIRFAPGFGAVVAAKAEDGTVTLDFALPAPDLLAALERHGAMPLPPYIRREGPDAQDRERYQTLFAARPGAVAAPTASLHFTPRLLAALEARGVGRATVTLHVGPGTFLPVRGDDPRDHRMHGERGEIGAGAAEAVNAARAAGGRVVAVGSTATRLLESAADESGRVLPFAGETALYILPGYRFRAIDLMMTNFHLPRSTLFMLVCAFAGTGRMKAAYAHAVAAGYRFYSYGDACLLEPESRQ